MHQAYELTGLENPNSVSQLKEWLSDNGVEIESLSKKAVASLVDETDGDIQELLRLRLMLSKTSVKKYEAVIRSVCSDGRVHGMMRFYGANRTGRWSGNILQPQNLPQNHLPDLTLARDVTKSGDYELLDMLYGNVPNVLSELIRTVLIPKQNHRFIVADFSAIEARVLSWAGFFSGVWESIKSIFGAVGAWFGGIFTAAVNAIKTAFSSVVGFFQGIWNSISSMFTKIGTTIADGISGAFKTVINAVISFAGGLINGFISAVNWAIDVINAIPGVNIPKLQEVNLPQLYKGGTAITAGAALVGERGPEIIDMPKGASVIPLDRSRREGDTYDYTTKNYYITLNIDAMNKSTDEIVNELVPKLKLALSNI